MARCKVIPYDLCIVNVHGIFKGIFILFPLIIGVMGTRIGKSLSNGTPQYFSSITVQNCGSCGGFHPGAKKIFSIYPSAPLMRPASTHKLKVNIMHSP